MFRLKNILLLWSFLGLSLLYGQTGYSVTKQYTYNDGLPSNEVLCLYKDSRDFLWVGTRYGVLVKDMSRFRLLTRLDELEFNNVLSIIEDNCQRLWFASSVSGLVMFDGNIPTKIDLKNGLVSNHIRKLFSSKNRVYVAASGGVSIINTSDLSIKNPAFTKHDNLIFEAVSFFENNGKVYVVTLNHGVYEVREDRLVLVNPYNRIINVYSDKNELYISSNMGITTFNLDDFLQKKEATSFVSFPVIWDILKYDSSTHFFTIYDMGSGNGNIMQWRNGEMTKKDVDFEVNTQFPKTLEMDKDNNILYIATLDQGIYEVFLNSTLEYKTIDQQNVIGLHRNEKYYTILTSQGLYVKTSQNKVNRLLKQEDFRNFALSKRREVEQLVKDKSNYYEIDYTLPNDRIKFFELVYNNHSYWISSNIGLFQLSIEGELERYLPIHTYHFTFLNNELIEVLPFSGVKIYTDLDRLKFTFFSDSQSNVPREVMSISKNKQAVFFATASDGLFKYENGQFTSYLQTNQFDQTKISSVKTIGQNQLLVATDFGRVYLFDIKGNRLIQKRIINVRQVGGENINFLEKIGQRIIVGTNRNLLIYDQDRLFIIDEDQGYRFKSVNAVLVRGEELILGVEKGYYIVNTKQIVEAKSPSLRVIITSVKINDKKLNRDQYTWFDLVDKKLNLENNQNNVNVDFSIVNAKFSHKFIYRVRLNPKEKWSEYFKDDFVNFKYLKFGHYKVQLEITDLNTSTKKVIDLIELNISAPFFLKWWFILGVIALLGGVIFWLYRMKIKTIKTINALEIDKIKQLNSIEVKREVLQQKLLETRLYALQSQMNPHFIFNVLNSIQYYIIDNDVDNALNSLGRFSHLIRQMLNISTKNMVNLKEELDFLSLYMEVENSRRKMPIQINVEIDKSIDVYKTIIPPMIIQPLLENVFVHAFDATSLHPKLMIRIDEFSNRLQITVEDNGRGFDHLVKKDHKYPSKAMRIIRERLQLIHKSSKDYLLITTSTSGTKVIITFLKEHLNTIEIN